MVETKVGCAIILHDPEKPGSVLIGKRSRKKSHPGAWELIGGTMEDDEQPEDCIRREVREELGAGLTDVRRSAPSVLYRDGRRCIVFNFLGVLQGDVRLNTEEVESNRWIGPGDIASIDFIPGCRETIAAYFARPTA